MKKLYAKIRTLALNSLKRDNLFSAFVKFLFFFFSSGYIRTVITILETVVIGIMTSKNYYGVWFYIVVISYCICLFLIACSEQYMREKLTETKHMKEGLKGKACAFPFNIYCSIVSFTV